MKFKSQKAVEKRFINKYGYCGHGLDLDHTGFRYFGTGCDLNPTGY